MKGETEKADFFESALSWRCDFGSEYQIKTDLDLVRRDFSLKGVLQRRKEGVVMGDAENYRRSDILPMRSARGQGLGKRGFLHGEG